ncbi:LLM class flavin-dependent oxidoreductase [Flindersiella endophytica]
MPDYGHDLLFGSFVTPDADQPDAVLRMAEQTEALGLDLVSVQDHPYQPGFLDTWTLLSVIAARTNRVTVLPNVANLPLRPPAVLARSAASLDILSGGRVELGLGAGGFADAIASMGGPRRSPAESVEALEEAIAVIRSLWTPGRGVRFSGSHYQLGGARPGPFPVHPIGIWVGSYKPRMLSLTGRLADGWLPSSPYAAPEELGAMNQRIDEGAEAAGRSAADVRRLYNIVGRFDGDGRAFLEGPPKIWVEQLAELALTEGISGFLMMAPLGGERELAMFAEEVAPGVRELVAQERSIGGGSGGGDGGAAGASPVVLTEPAAEPADDNGLGVQPTPDDGQRLTTTRLWDESERPAGPEFDPSTVYTEAGRASSRQLIGIHDHLRQELTQIRDLVQQVMDGSLDVGSARSMINTMTMRQNNWTLGAYCESYCRLVTMHHTAEDRMLFPQLRRNDPLLAPVVARLEEEHHVIADVLERVDAALVGVVSKPDGLAELRHAVDLLTDTLLSHLSYEERELVEPLARLPLRI